MRQKNALLAIALAVALSIAIVVATRPTTPSTPKSAFVFPAAVELPSFSLLDQNGTVVTAETFRGQWHLVFFGFTHCPDICPVTLQTLTAARRQLDESGVEQLPRIVLVSVDPERDTPTVLGQYMAHFGGDNLGVTGELEEISKLTKALGIYFQKHETPADNYAVDHSAAVLVFNPQGQSHALFGAPHIIADYVHDLPIIMGE